MSLYTTVDLLLAEFSNMITANVPQGQIMDSLQKIEDLCSTEGAATAGQEFWQMCMMTFMQIGMKDRVAKVLEWADKKINPSLAYTMMRMWVNIW